MPGLYAPVPRWAGELDFLSLIVVPTWFIASFVIRTCLRLPPPPRAVFEITAERFKLCFHDPTGQVTEFDFPRSAVAEARANRYERGLWLNVPGHIKDTYLADLAPE